MAENTFDHLRVSAFVHVAENIQQFQPLDAFRLLCAELDDIRGKLEAGGAARAKVAGVDSCRECNRLRGELAELSAAATKDHIEWTIDRRKLRDVSDGLRAELSQKQAPPAPILAALSELEPSLGPTGYEYCQVCGVPLKHGHAPRCMRAAWELLRDYLTPPAMSASPENKPRHLWRAQGGMTLSCQLCPVLHDPSRDREMCPKALAQSEGGPPKDEPFRPGLPPEALRRTGHKWEDLAGDILQFSTDGCSYDWMIITKEDRSDFIIWNPVSQWGDRVLRPHARTWLSVQTAAAEMIGREDAKHTTTMRTLGGISEALGMDVYQLWIDSNPVRIAYVEAFEKVKTNGR